MRVLLTTDTVGGVWTFTRELASELLSRGHSVALLSFGPRPSESQNAWVLAMGRRHKKRFFFRSRDVPLEWMAENDRTWIDGEEELLSVFDDCSFEPEILHSSQFCWGTTNFGYPIVLTAHSDVLSWAEACRPGGLQETPWLARYEQLVREGLDLADMIAAPTAWMAETLTRVYGLTKPVSVVPNGRDLTARAAPGGERHLQAVTAGRFWDEAKGLASLAGLTSPMPLLIAGELNGPDGAADRSALPANARLLGSLNEKKLQSTFSSSAVYLAASLYEPFGLAPLEAALCGCAVVARDLPSFREVWDDGAVYFQDTAELQAILEFLARDAVALAAAQARSRARAQRYTVARMADAYLQVYEEAIRAVDLTGEKRPYVPLPRLLQRPDPEPWNAS